MSKIEFEAEQKLFGSPFVVAYDELSEHKFPKSSILVTRKHFEGQSVPERIRVTVEWADE